MSKEMKCNVGFTLTASESIKVYELSKKLKLSKSRVIALLITKAQLIENADDTFQLADESLVIQKGQPDGN